MSLFAGFVTCMIARDDVATAAAEPLGDRVGERERESHRNIQRYGGPSTSPAIARSPATAASPLG